MKAIRVIIKLNYTFAWIINIIIAICGRSSLDAVLVQFQFQYLVVLKFSVQAGCLMFLSIQVKLHSLVLSRTE